MTNKELKAYVFEEKRQGRSERAENETVAEIKRLAKNKLLEAKYSYYSYGGIRNTRKDADRLEEIVDG